MKKTSPAGREPERGGTPSHSAFAWVVAGLAVASAGLAGSVMATWERSPPEAAVTDRPIELPSDGYVSSGTCATCHPAQYATWFGSYHRSMTQVATPESVLADFDGVRISAEHGGPMTLERRGDEFWAEFDDPDWDPASGAPPRITRRVVMITGSHHQQVYWYPTGRDRLLGQLPAMYLIREQRWISRQAAFLRPPEFPESETGRWNVSCVNCHATRGMGELEAAVDRPPREWRASTTVAELGIACEACHGPGETHRAVNMNPLRRYWLHLTGRPDPTTVFPLGLESRLSSQVCGQCHSIWLGETPSEGLAYRPGENLTETRDLIQPSRQIGTPRMQEILAQAPTFLEDHFWSDGMVRVSGREYNGLIDSPCYANATAESDQLSCLSCHTMHKTADDPRSIEEWADTHQVGSGMYGNGACLQCHQALGQTLTTHTRHEVESSGSTCYNCHMPYTSYGLLRAQRSHEISSPDVAATLETGRPNACNLCHLDRTLEWTSRYLEAWYGTPRPTLDQDQQGIAASVLWSLSGDAGNRALTAWSMGWSPAQEASGTSWMLPYLGLGLDDPYDAVRFIAGRSLGTLPGFADFSYDFLGSTEHRLEATSAAMAMWRTLGGAGPRTEAPLLLIDNGFPLASEWQRLLLLRDHRRVRLLE